MKKILITGGAGFIGYHLTLQLLKEECDITLVDNFSRGVHDDALLELKNKKNIHIADLDLIDYDKVMTLDRDFDYIYHFAAIIGVQNVIEHSYDVLTKNVILLTNMISLAKEQQHLQRFVFASTSEIYAGTLEYFEMQIPTPEVTPLAITSLDAPRTSYMLSKIYGEALVRQAGIPYTIVRPHNFYGPRMGMSHVIPELLKKVRDLPDGEELPVYSVEHTRTFCYIDDAVMMIKLLAEDQKALNEVFNVGNQEPEVTIEQVAKLVISTVGKKVSIHPMPATSGSPTRRCPNTEKMLKCVGYESKTDLAMGIMKTYQWYSENIFSGKTLSAR